MAREQAPAFQFYPKDFLTSERVRLMSYTERGIYITMLCHCWLEGSLPSDHKVLSKLVQLPIARFTRLFTNSIGACFRLNEADGRLYNPRLDVERSKQESYRRRQSDKGRASAEARFNRGSTVVQPALVQPDGNSSISNLHTPVKKGATHLEPPKKPADPRVGEFLKWFPEEFRKRRNGAEYLVKHGKHGALVKQMLGATDLERLKKYAAIMLKTNDDFIAETDRGIEILSARFSWLSDKLAAWEANQAAS